MTHRQRILLKRKRTRVHTANRTRRLRAVGRALREMVADARRGMTGFELHMTSAKLP